MCSWLLNSIVNCPKKNSVVNYWMPLDQWLLTWDSKSWCSHSSGISHSAKGYCLISVLETMKTYSAEEGLTEEAVVTKLRICRYHHLYLHSSLRNNSSGCNLYSWTFLFILIMIFFYLEAIISNLTSEFSSLCCYHGLMALFSISDEWPIFIKIFRMDTIWSLESFFFTLGLELCFMRHIL